MDFFHLPRGHAVDAEHRLGGAAARQPSLVRWMIAVDDDGEDDDRPLKSHYRQNGVHSTLASLDGSGGSRHPFLNEVFFLAATKERGRRSSLRDNELRCSG